MSRRDYRPPENWQSGHEYWIYMPTNLSHFVPAGRSLNGRGQTTNPWWLFEERSVREPNYGLASLPSVAPARHLGPLLLIDEYDTYPGARTHTPHAPWYNQGSSTGDQESRLSPQEQKQALNKLRKQLYSPHINNIIKRLGTKSSVRNAAEDDDGTKRCAVCLDDFESKQFVTITPCNHMFHEDCIVPWVKSQGKCPVCRFVIS
ncbi:ring finger protein 215 [Phtheirospermum japonicum]|uniref:Ring finger protein 215 n=1 Tax=Phtheirospermum japonicum TaxID=374723 RepID=A0A830BUY9_9LAMI|nr:ring finger protein 215 [Phtheirospermum japonicum]